MTRAEYRAQLTRVLVEVSAILILLERGGGVGAENSSRSADKLSALKKALANGCERTGDGQYTETCQSVMREALRQVTFLKGDGNPRSYRVLLRVKTQMEQRLREVGGRPVNHLMGRGATAAKGKS